MSWRTVIITQRAKLDMKNGYLVVRTEHEQKRVHLSEISVLLIENCAVSITGCLLVELLITVNLRSYLSYEETNTFFRSVILHKLYVLCIENMEYPDTGEETRIIIDKDLCVI